MYKVFSNFLRAPQGLRSRAADLRQRPSGENAKRDLLSVWSANPETGRLECRWDKFSDNDEPLGRFSARLGVVLSICRQHRSAA